MLYSLQRTPPEDGQTRWPKHVAGYAVYNKVNLLTFICSCWSYIS